MFKCECASDLILVVKEELTNKYEIKENGILELWDVDSSGQILYLQCTECDKRYEFDDSMLSVENRPYIVRESMRNVHKRDLVDVEELKILQS